MSGPQKAPHNDNHPQDTQSYPLQKLLIMQQITKAFEKKYNLFVMNYFVFIELFLKITTNFYFLNYSCRDE